MLIGIYALETWYREVTSLAPRRGKRTGQIQKIAGSLARQWTFPNHIGMRMRWDYRELPAEF
jgi:hypothetical protein